MTKRLSAERESRPWVPVVLQVRCPEHDAPAGVPCWQMDKQTGAGVCGKRITEALGRLGAGRKRVDLGELPDAYTRRSPKKKAPEPVPDPTKHHHRHPNRRKLS